MTEPLFVDSSAWYAYRNREDPEHGRVTAVLDRARRRFASTYVFDETVTLTQARLGHAAAVRIGEYLRDPLIATLLEVDADVERRAWELFLARPDKTYSFTDCTSFVLMRREGLRTCAALDDDFRREGFLVLPR